MYTNFKTDIVETFDLHRKFSEFQEQIQEYETNKPPLLHVPVSSENWCDELPHKKMRLSLISESNFEMEDSSSEEEKSEMDSSENEISDQTSTEEEKEDELELQLKKMRKEKIFENFSKQKLLEHLKRNENNFKKITNFKFNGQNQTLKEYQESGINWLIKNWFQKRSCILADEMGLGIFDFFFNKIRKNNSNTCISSFHLYHSKI
jgi:SNF2 family DNA or RNA helicase